MFSVRVLTQGLLILILDLKCGAPTVSLSRGQCVGGKVSASPQILNTCPNLLTFFAEVLMQLGRSFAEG